MPCRISGKIIGRISGQISIQYNPNRYLSYITFSHDGSSSKHGGMVLHGLLHFYPDLGGRPRRFQSGGTAQTPCPDWEDLRKNYNYN